jgi:hypothetical protein
VNVSGTVHERCCTPVSVAGTVHERCCTLVSVARAGFLQDQASTLGAFMTTACIWKASKKQQSMIFILLYAIHTQKR